MERFDDDLHGIEDELRRHRPEPRPEFLAQLANRASAATKRRREKHDGSRLRLGLALGFAALFATAFAAVGALGYAETSATDAVKGTVSAVTEVVKPGMKTERPAANRPASDGRRFVPAETARSSTGRVATLRRGSSPGATAALFQYPRFVVVCVSFGRTSFTIVLPRFLIPFFQPFIVNLGPCASSTRSGSGF
jgi:hypothetical protein